MQTQASLAQMLMTVFLPPSREEIVWCHRAFSMVFPACQLLTGTPLSGACTSSVRSSAEEPVTFPTWRWLLEQARAGNPVAPPPHSHCNPILGAQRKQDLEFSLGHYVQGKENPSGQFWTGFARWTEKQKPQWNFLSFLKRFFLNMMLSRSKNSHM